MLTPQNSAPTKYRTVVSGARGRDPRGEEIAIDVARIDGIEAQASDSNICAFSSGFMLSKVLRAVLDARTPDMSPIPEAEELSSEALVELLEQIETKEASYGKHRKQVAKELSTLTEQYNIHSTKKRKQREEAEAKAAAKERKQQREEAGAEVAESVSDGE